MPVRRTATTGLTIAVLLSAAAGALSTARAGPADPAVTLVTVDGSGDAGRLNRALVGFNWRAGGGAVAPLAPRVIRSFAARLATVAPAAGVFDFTALDAEVDAIEATGAIPLLVIIERPAWSPAAGSAGYEAAVAAVVRRFAVERVAAGHPAAWFESGNEPEFPPTSHGQLPPEFALDIAAQARAVRSVEAADGAVVTWGGPGALFPDPAVVAGFMATARAAGRLPDFVSWHLYPNQPLLGPDGPEDTSNPAAVAFWEANHGVNPAATPREMGLAVDAIRATVTAALLPGERAPDLVLSEWNLSAGGLDRRHDSHVGAAFVLASLVEQQRAGLDAGTFFSTVDRHCTDPTKNPTGATFCGDWGTASASGERKPVWHAFALFGLLGDTVLPIDGDDPLGGLWALAARAGDGRVGIALASFSASQPAARVVAVQIDHLTPGDVNATVRRIDAEHPDPAAEPIAVEAGTIIVTLPANSAALVELVPQVAGTGAPAPSVPARGDVLPATGVGSPLSPVLASLLAAALVGRLVGAARS